MSPIPMQDRELRTIGVLGSSGTARSSVRVGGHGFDVKGEALGPALPSDLAAPDATLPY